MISWNMHIYLFQLLPYYVMDRLNYPGIPGLFLACLFAGALRYTEHSECQIIQYDLSPINSTMSSALGALAAVVWEDMLKPFKWAQNLSNFGQTLVLKILGMSILLDNSSSQ